MKAFIKNMFHVVLNAKCLITIPSVHLSIA